MLDRHTAHRYESRGLRFLHALRQGDAAALADLWREAERDATLCDLFSDLLLAAAAGASDESSTRPPHALPPFPQIVVHHHTPAQGSHLNAGSVKKAR